MKLKQINIYPVKSLTGIQTTKSNVTPIGLEHDRTMMLVDENGVFVSQRKFPKMALVSTKLSHNGIKVAAPGMPDIQVAGFTDKLLSVQVWSSKCLGFVAKDVVNQWFSLFLNKPVTLVSYDYAQPRTADPVFSKPNDTVSFADGFPLLVISQGSLDDLNSRLEHPVSMANFRPNVVVEGFSAYAEDEWKRIRIGKVEFEAVKPCSRCVLTTVNPKTGIKNHKNEPLKTLSRYRKTKVGVIFGMNLIPRSQGTIRVGDLISCQ